MDLRNQIPASSRLRETFDQYYRILYPALTNENWNPSLILSGQVVPSISDRVMSIPLEDGSVLVLLEFHRAETLTTYSVPMIFETARWQAQGARAKMSLHRIPIQIYRTATSHCSRLREIDALR